MAAAVHGLMAVEGAPGGAEPGQGRVQGGLVVLDANHHGVAGRRRLGEGVLLAMQRVSGEQHAREAKLGHQRRHGRDLVRRTGQLLVRQDQGGVARERAEHVDCFAVGQVIKAAAQRLAIKRDRAQRLRGGACVQVAGMVAEGCFEIVAAERQEQVAQGVHRRSPPEAGAEDGVQALALQGDEGDDLLVGRRARKRGKDREQQQVAHAVALALRTARIRHFGKGGKQDSERHRATSTKLEGRLIQPLRHPAAAHA